MKRWIIKDLSEDGSADHVDWHSSEVRDQTWSCWSVMTRPWTHRTFTLSSKHINVHTHTHTHTLNTPLKACERSLMRSGLYACMTHLVQWANCAPDVLVCVQRIVLVCQWTLTGHSHRQQDRVSAPAEGRRVCVLVLVWVHAGEISLVWIYAFLCLIMWD